MVSPYGVGTELYWENLVAGRSAVRQITSFPLDGYTTTIGAEVLDFDPLAFLDKREARRMDRFAQFAVACAAMAVEQAGLVITPELSPRVGVMIGSGIGGILTWEEQHRLLLERGPERVSPFFVPMMITNMAAGEVSMRFQAKGPNTAVATACASGAHAIGDALNAIRRGEADVMLAGGSETGLAPLAMAGFCALKALSRRNGEPEKASRPFDAKRDGLVLGEGAAVVVLEELHHALNRGAQVIGELVGYGMSADAFHMVQPAPGGEGAALAMTAALRSAGLNPSDVDYVNAHGTATPAGDAMETAGIKAAFGDHARKLAVSSTKSMIGHLLGAAGAVEFVAALLACQRSIIHPTINYEYPDSECDLDYVPNQARPAQVRIAMSNSFGFGGQNAVLIAKRWDGE